MFDAVNAEATYRRQQISRDWRRGSGRVGFRRFRAVKRGTDPAQTRRAPLVTPVHWA